MIVEFECYIGSLHSISGSKLSGQIHIIEYALLSDTRPPILHSFDSACCDILFIMSPPSNSAVMGGLLASRLHKLGVKGVITNGAIRDIEEIENLRLNVFYKSNTVYGSKHELKVVQVGGSIMIGNCNVCEGDFMMGDIDGVVCIPEKWIARVYDECKFKIIEDEECKQGILQGESLQTVFAKYRT